MYEDQNVTDLCDLRACLAPHADGARICTTHMAELAQALERLVRVEEDLDIAISRQARLAEHTGGGRPAERPLPFHWDGAQAKRSLTDTVTRWALAVADDAGWTVDLDAVLVPPPPRHARSPLAAITRTDPATGEQLSMPEPRDPAAMPYRSGPAARAAHWLAQHPRRLRSFPQLGALADDVLAVAGLTQHVIDRAPTRWYIGLCDVCEEPLYTTFAFRADSKAPCRNPDCPGVDGRPAVYNVGERREWLLDAARDYMVTAAEASRAVPLLTHPDTGFTYSTFRDACGGPELPADRTHPAYVKDGRPRYRLGDCIAWAEARAEARRLAGRHAS